MFDVTIRIQDDESNDYECPFTARVCDEDLAKILFYEILARRDYVDTTIRDRYGLGFGDNVWIQLFIIDEDADFNDEDTYWLSYEVL